MGEPDYAIDVAGLSKDFRVYHRTYTSLKSHAAALAKNLARHKPRDPFEIRRVLEDVTFRISRGEVVALMGRNGCGKSTLLSILSRVYLPTSGEVRLRGRLVSLLELGAGFNDELTGTDNIFFNGAVLGLTQDQVAARYDQIVDFAELGTESMDLPVRMYSSGMLLRLGFSVAVHMDADTLLIDEGLAVGDLGFQKKCLAKMEAFKAEGKTIVIVTHDLTHVLGFAHRGIWLENGRIACDGDLKTVAAEYYSTFKKPA